MDVIGLSKFEIENGIANLGTALTDKQIYMVTQFFDNIIICFDGDESGYKAAIRAAENSIKSVLPDKQIYFLFLPDGEDPDTFVEKKGKNEFLNFFNINPSNSLLEFDGLMLKKFKNLFLSKNKINR